MSVEEKTSSRSAHIVVVGNEKGGSGKSTIAMHIAVALIKSGQSVATIDLDSRQRSFTQYIENRRAWAERVGRDLQVPSHLCVGENDYPKDAAGCEALADAVDALAQTHGFIVVDTPGHDSDLTRLAHSIADTIVTPLNDSFVDFGVLGTVDPETYGVTGTSHYAQMVDEARRQRQLVDNVNPDWIVLRNRLSTLGSRNKRLVGEALNDLSQRLDFRSIEGLAERVIFREFYPRGLTAVDDLDEITLGTRPTMSHVTARMEMENLLSSMRLDGLTASEGIAGSNRDAA
ncbi:MAG: division plane positioning ATPase MipZ [Pseudolabrys sp.]